MFYRRGLIEHWGRGTQKNIALSRAAGHPDPEFQEIAGSVVVTFRQISGSITPQVTTEVAHLLPLCLNPRSKKDLREELGLRNDIHFRKANLAPALIGGMIEMTIHDKPNSRLQKYHLTAKGRVWLTQRTGE